MAGWPTLLLQSSPIWFLKVSCLWLFSLVDINLKCDLRDI